MKYFVFIVLFPLIFEVSQAQLPLDIDSLYAQSQIDRYFETILKFPNFDTINFQFRFSVSSTGLGNAIIIINKYNDGNWKYFRATEHENKYLEIPLKEENFNLSLIWEQLLSNNILNLSSQRSSSTLIKRHKKINKLARKDSEKLYQIGSTCYTLELLFPDNIIGYRRIYPLLLTKRLNESNLDWIAPKHDPFANIVNIINNHFDIKGLLKEGYLHWKK